MAKSFGAKPALNERRIFVVGICGIKPRKLQNNTKYIIYIYKNYTLKTSKIQLLFNGFR